MGDIFFLNPDLVKFCKSFGSFPGPERNWFCSGCFRGFFSTVLPICNLFLFTCACAGLLPDYMKGEFQLEGSEGYTNFLYELGIDFFTRYFMNSLTPIQKIT